MKSGRRRSAAALISSSSKSTAAPSPSNTTTEQPGKEEFTSRARARNTHTQTHERLRQLLSRLRSHLLLCQELHAARNLIRRRDEVLVRDGLGAGRQLQVSGAWQRVGDFGQINVAGSVATQEISVV